MRPKIQVYLTEEELAHVRQAARRRRVTVSRYAKERLLPFGLDDDHSAADSSLETGTDRELPAALRSAVTAGNRATLDQLRTLIVMLDQFVLSAFTHLPESADGHTEHARASAERRYQAWQTSVEEMIRRLRVDNTEQDSPLAPDGARP